MIGWRRHSLFSALGLALLLAAKGPTAYAQETPETPAPAQPFSLTALTGNPYFWIAITAFLALTGILLAVLALVRKRKPAGRLDDAEESTLSGGVLPKWVDERIKASSAAIQVDMAERFLAAENERAALQRQLDPIAGSAAAARTLADRLETDARKLREEYARLKQEFEQTSQRIAGLNESLLDYAQLSHITELSQAQDRRAEQAKAEFESLRREIARRTLEVQFEEWKVARLQPLLNDQASAGLAEFKSVEQNGIQLRAAQEQLAKIADRSARLVSALEARARDFERLGTQEPEWALPARKYLEFRSRLQRFHSSVAQLLEASNLEGMQPEPVDRLTFTDLVTGRSAEFLRNAYGRRLASALAVLTQNAEEAGREWQAIRSDLFSLLDVVYPAEPFRNFAAGSASVAAFVAALDSIRVQEISVREASTAYDPTLHEPIAGDRQSRADLPENTVLKLLRRGYYMDSKVQRRALVSLSTAGIAHAL